MLLQCSNDELRRSYSCWFETEDSRGIRQSRDRDMQITASRDSLEPRQLPVSSTTSLNTAFNYVEIFSSSNLVSPNGVYTMTATNDNGPKISRVEVTIDSATFQLIM